MIQYIIENNQWIFSGVGVAVIGGIIGLFFRSSKFKENAPTSDLSDRNHSNADINITISSTFDNSRGKEKQDEILKTALLPPAKSIGNHLKTEVDRIIEKRKESIRKKEYKNIIQHIHAVSKEVDERKYNIQKKLGSENIAVLYEWIEGAKKVDPNCKYEKSLSSIWQELLIKISHGETPEPDYFSTLKSLRPIEGKILLSFRGRYIQNIYALAGDKKNSREKHKVFMRELKAYGLVGKININEYFSNFLKRHIIISFLISVALSSASFVDEGVTVDESVYLLMTCFSIIFFLLLARAISSSWKLTEKGEYLVSFAPSKKS